MARLLTRHALAVAACVATASCLVPFDEYPLGDLDVGTGGTGGGTTTSGSGGGGGAGGIALTGAFVAAAVDGAKSGVTLRGQLSWHAELAGERDGIALRGSFR